MTIEKKFAEVVERITKRPYERVKFRYDYFLGGVDVEGKDIVDIGAGGGLLSGYLAVRGARRVVAVEPEMAGSLQGWTSDIQRLICEVGLEDRVSVVADDFVTAPLEDASFDIAVCQSAINHIREVSDDIRFSGPARDAQRLVIRRMAEVLRPGGTLIASDYARANLWGRLGRWGHWSPFAQTTIEWDKHQDPDAWGGVMLEEGFTDYSVRWWVPWELRRAAWLISNRPVNYLTMSHFYMIARRAAQPSAVRRRTVAERA